MQTFQKYHDILSGQLSRVAIDLVIESAGDDPSVFAYLVNLVTSLEEPLASRAAWALDGIHEKYPDLLKPHLAKIVKSIGQFKHTGTTRNVLKLFTRIDIPKKHHETLVQLCFDFLYNKDIPVAVKVYSMQIIENLSSHYPELRQELHEILRDQYDRSSAGFQSRASKILKGRV
jgi:hypothetical protein